MNDITKIQRFITWGEILLRFSPPGFEKLFWGNTFNAHFGGAETNCAVLLSQLGIPTTIITLLPNNEIGKAAQRFLRGFGVKTNSILFKDKSRMGLYFYEKGVDLRPSHIIYDRQGSAFANYAPGEIQWDAVIPTKSWLHTTGITLALSPTMLAESIRAIDIVKQRGGVVSFDMNYRQTLWENNDKAKDAFLQIVKKIDILIGNEEHILQFLLQKDFEKTTLEHIINTLFTQFPNLNIIMITYRQGYTVSHATIGAAAASRSNVVNRKTMEISSIVDRIGAGDAIAAGFIYGLMHNSTLTEAVDSALAMGALAHSVDGDSFIVDLDDVDAILQQKSSRLLR